MTPIEKSQSPMRAESETLAEVGSVHIARLPVHGLWVPALTAVTESLELDKARSTQHARWLLAQGAHGIALFGTTSEANSFSLEERMEYLEHLVEAGVPPRELMVGTGCCAFPDSVRLTRHAMSLGCNKVLMLPPFYYKNVSDEGLFASFSRIIEEVDDPSLRIVLYHFPRMSATPITLGLLERLSDAYPKIIAGVKDSSGDFGNTVAMLEQFPHLAIFPGSEKFLLGGLEKGGAGVISATANANPAAIRGVFDAWSAGNGDAAARQEAVNTVRGIFEQHSVIAALKHVVAHYRGMPGWVTVRPPLVAFSEEEGARLVAELEASGFTLAV